MNRFLLLLSTTLSLLQACVAGSLGNANFTGNGSVSEDIGMGTLIVGGTNANKNEFPWLVHISVDYGSNTGFCGGSLLDADLVLTAAHCIPQKYRSINVVAGDHNRDIVETSEQASTASGVKRHEKYDSETFKNDIALIRLSKRLNITTSVRTVSLPPKNQNLAGYAVAAGWGSISETNQRTHPILQKVTVPIVTDTTCTSQLTDRSLQFCAGTWGKDSCQGDSGGGLICTSMPQTVCGIVSYGEGCGRPNKPGVYTKVSAYVDWINKNRSFSSASDIKSQALLILSPALALMLLLSKFSQ